EIRDRKRDDMNAGEHPITPFPARWRSPWLRTANSVSGERRAVSACRRLAMCADQFPVMLVMLPLLIKAEHRQTTGRNGIFPGRGKLPESSFAAAAGSTHVCSTRWIGLTCATW